MHENTTSVATRSALLAMKGCSWLQKDGWIDSRRTVEVVVPQGLIYFGNARQKSAAIGRQAHSPDLRLAAQIPACPRLL